MASSKKTITLRVKSTPFGGEPEGATAYYEALGRALVLWGRFEVHFSGCLMIILSLPEAASITAPLPISWNNRAAFWRKAFKVLPSLEPFQEPALSLIGSIMDSIGDRHLMAHGSWGEFVGTDPLTMKVNNISPKRGSPGVIEFANYKITIDKLREIASEVDSFNTQLLPISFFLGSLQQPPDIHKP